jgi:protein TonB
VSAAARPLAAERGESRATAIAASALLAAAAHAVVLFGVRLESHPAVPRPSAIEVALAEPGPVAPERSPLRPRPSPRAERPRARALTEAPAREPEPKAAAEPAAAAPARTAAVATGPPPQPGAIAGVPGTPTAGASSARPRYKLNPPPLYPPAARRRGQQGIVLLSVRVDASGRPEAVDVQASSGFRVLDEAARAAVERWEFEPGRLNGAPVPSQAEVPIRFELDRD